MVISDPLTDLGSLAVDGHQYTGVEVTSKFEHIGEASGQFAGQNAEELPQGNANSADLSDISGWLAGCSAFCCGF